jgi:hypothetical protein
MYLNSHGTYAQLESLFTLLPFVLTNFASVPVGMNGVVPEYPLDLVHPFSSLRPRVVQLQDFLLST